MKLKLKVDEEGHAVVQDGKPVYIYEDGREAPFDAGAAMQKINELNQENADRRHQNKELEEQIKVYRDKDGNLLDAEQAINAIETVKNLNDKEMYDATQVESLKAQMNKAYIEKEEALQKHFKKELEELQGTLNKKNDTIYGLMVRSKFATSPTILDKTNLPPDMAADYFGKNFKVEGDGDNVKVIGYLDSEKIFSRERPGNPADFEEALQAVIDAYPMKDRIMRATAGGSGAGGAFSIGPPGSTDTRLKSQLKDLPPVERLKVLRKFGISDAEKGS